MPPSVRVVDLSESAAGHVQGLILAAVAPLCAGDRLVVRTREDPELALRSVNMHLQHVLAWRRERHAGAGWETVVERVDARSARHPIDQLLLDHRLFDSWLGAVMRLIEAGAGARARDALHTFAGALTRHVEVEDQWLAPLLGAEARLGPDAPLAAMATEHEDILVQLRALSACLTEAHADLLEASILCGMLSAVLAKHEHREEAGLFPLWRSALARLPAPEYGAIAARIGPLLDAAALGEPPW